MPTADEQFLDKSDDEVFLDAPRSKVQSDEAFLDTPSPSLRPVVPAPRENVRAGLPTPQPSLQQQERAFEETAARERERANLTPAQIERLDEGDFVSALTHPPPGFEAPTITREQVLRRFPTITEGNAGVLAGVLQTAAGAWNFAASPRGAAMAAAAASGGPIGAAALATFAFDALKQLPDAHEALIKAFESKDEERIAQAASGLALQLSVLFGGAKGVKEVVRGVVAPEGASEPVPKPDALEPPTVSKQASSSLGIMPPGAAEAQQAMRGGVDFAKRAADYFTPPKPDALPEVRIEHGARVPRLQPYEAEKQLATSPEGMARVPVLGALVDPRATAKTGPDVAIITRAYSVNKARSLAALWAETQFRNKDLFMADEKTGTIPLANGNRGYMSDIIEGELRDPGSQPITEAQRNWINHEWKPLLEDVRSMLEEEGVREVSIDEIDFDVANDYFPRPVVGKRNREAAPAQGAGGRPGSAPFFEKKRLYETEHEGARIPTDPADPKQEVIVYDPSAISRVTKFLLGAYRAVADQRLANDASLGGQTVKQRYEALVEANRDRLDTLETEAATGGDARKEAEVQLMAQAAHPILGKEEALHIAPAFQGKIYPIESAQKLKSAYADEVRGWVRAAQTITSATKAMQATADMSAPLVQGAAMMGRHPLLWAKSTLNSYRSLLDPNVTAKVLEHPEYRAAAEEFVQSGGTLLQLQDFLAGKEQTALATRIPGFGRIIETTGRAYGTFLDLAKLELWRAWKPVTASSDLGRLAESIENSLFMGRMESVGLSPHRTVGERLMLFAPMYYRGAGSLVASALQRGVGGQVARQMLAGYATASALLTVGSWLALGLSEEEMLKRLDPTRGIFMKVPVPLANGTQIEVGFGNVLTQLLRLTGQAIAWHTGDKPIDLETGVENNPYLKFLRGRSAFLPSLGIELATGRDFLGNAITAKSAIARRFMPFALQSIFPHEKPLAPEGAKDVQQRAMDAAFSFLGLNAFPESEYAAQLRHMDDEVRKEHGGKTLFELPLADRARAVRSFRERPDYLKREPTAQDMRRYLAIDVERQASLKNRLDKDVREQLDRLGLRIGPYKSTVTIGGVDIPLSKAEQTRYEQLLAEAYNKHLAKLPKEAATLTPAQRARWWEKYGTAIREEARHKLITELAKPKKE